MIVAGIDCGNEFTKCVIMKDGSVVARAKVPTDFDINLAAKEAYGQALAVAGVDAADAITTTGAGREAVDFRSAVATEIAAAAAGAYYLNQDVQMLIDLGAEGYRAISVKENGAVNHYEGNDRCAAGSGTFIETMARTLQVGIDDMDSRAQQHTDDITIASQCVVFAESEVVSLIHQKQTVENIAYGVISGVANRVATVAKREGIRENTAFIGGLGTCKTMVECLSKEIGKELIVFDEPQYVSATGAAVLAAKKSVA